MNNALSSRGFVNAMTTNNVLGENGMPTNSTSTSRLVDLFFKQGALRKTPSNVVSLFTAALQEDTLLALKSMFYNRDIRGGQQERATFRAMFQWLCLNQPELAIKNLTLVPEYGRWDDLFVAYGTPVWNSALKLIKGSLFEGNGLCAKWMVREGKKGWNTYGKSVYQFMNMSLPEYRRLLVSLTKVVETQMCNNEWSAIKYSQVPSNASNMHRKAFLKHDAERFNQFIKDVKAGKTTIHAATLFPSDLVHKIIESIGYNSGYSYSSYGRTTNVMSKSEQDAIQVQWDALPDYMPEGEMILPVCDLSGSMHGQPYEVSMALGIYLSERNKGPFKDFFITFSRTPKFNYLSGGLYDKVVEMTKMKIAENTNLQAVFDMVLTKAMENNLPESEMPRTILVISDMQFDTAVDGYKSLSAQQMITKKYSNAGYQLPNIVYWDVNDSIGVPVNYNQVGAALVSGYSPSIMKQVMMNEMTPEKVMLKTLNSERYERVTI